MDYPYEKIVKLAQRIGNMREKKYKNDLKQIKKIIEDSNPDIKERMTKNNNGYFLPDFESYSCDTYIQLTKYLDEMDERTYSNSENDSIKKSLYFSEKTDEHSENKKLKYTNSENHILNKRKYEEALKIHQNGLGNESEKNINNNSEKIAQILIKKDSENSDSNKKPESSDKIFKKQEKTSKDKKK
jgi:hypothetical protein